MIFQLRHVMALLMLGCGLLFNAPLWAASQSVAVIVSDRSAPYLVAGAHQLKDMGSDAQIDIRTVSQLAEMDDQQLSSLLANKDALLLVAVFGDAVDRLLSMPLANQKLRMVIHSDRRLLALQQGRQGAIFGHGLPDDIVSEKTALLDASALETFQKQHPKYHDWLQARAYWLNRSVENARALLAMLANGNRQQSPLVVVSPLRFALHHQGTARWLDVDALSRALTPLQPTLWILDHDTGDLAGEWALHQQFCQAQDWQCVSVLASWGQPSVEAVKTINAFSQNATPTAVLALQDFVIGGGDGREAVLAELKKLNVPVLKGLRVGEWSEADWQLSDQGLPRDSIHYRLAMPELQGVSQAQLLALAEPQQQDPLTGASLFRSKPLAHEVQRQARRLQRWLDLQVKANADKRVAIVYYNHPPGRHNIGADNLNVPESLLTILQSLKAAGYTTGEIPGDTEELLDILQAQGVNLPEDAKALAEMAGKVAGLSATQYQQWFETLPASVQAEMVAGPLGALQTLMQSQVSAIASLASASARQARAQFLEDRMHSTITDLHHAMDGLRHKGRARALDLLAQLEEEYLDVLQKLTAGQDLEWQRSQALVDAIVKMKIEGIRGWGDAPGKVMVWQGRQLIPGVQFGNVFLGPQPPRGWEINEELLHANMSFPPPHQYLGFYHYLQDVFSADAMVHVGRHSTYEFLPKRSTGLGEADYPSIIAGDIPGIYPYIVDGVGEGIQAKRRGLAVMVDHLTPPLAITELYDDLLQLRQLIESAEAATDSQTRSRAVQRLRETIDELELRDELIASMDEELQVRGVGFDDIDEEFLLHEVGHYLTNIQEDFMPLGLHVFGQNWTEAALDTMVNSMIDGNKNAPSDLWRQQLKASPKAEMDALLNGLNGGFVAPGKGNDPIRTPAALPTGRNFYALDGSLLPTQLAFTTGETLANKVLSGESGVAAHTEDIAGNKQGVILWASDAVRDEGAMIAFGMKLLGVKPIWNSRGIIKGLQRLPLSASQPKRFDVVFTTSGLFRDLYGEHMLLLDKASLLALDASRDRIIKQFPALTTALRAALKPLGEWQQGGNEPLDKNQVANNWVNQARKILAEQGDIDAETLGRQASVRVFGIAPGSYGAGINRLVERSGAWKDRSELAEVFSKRMGHAYGVGLDGQAAPALFRQQLAGISQTYLGRASNLYGLVDNNDAFDYLGGFNLAVETVRGKAPASAVINHADGNDLRIDALHTAILSELRGRFFNPQWIKPLMNEGYSGARTMGSEFIEYLWGWQVTSPEIINDWVWQEVKAVYVDDKLDLGLDDFLSDGHNRYVQSNILAVMLVAVDKGFWQADEATVKQLAEAFADNIIEHGNPGSGHTHANHPMYNLVKTQLSAEKAAALEKLLAESRRQQSIADKPVPSHIQEVQVDANTSPPPSESSTHASSETASDDTQWYWLWILAAGLLLIAMGAVRGRSHN
ncbi:CobN/Magnesium Chelatase [Spongiibacter sp. IMCC21906]|uniref:cobaltochelatase subunit CobN n=1 Tax=Spongiibacter sp. IMCC21906 TaxID=1620392 RepID=UPI00062DFCC7|nr:cobaltochelatase subunit CobN [Spongiibacter sp. IMCC21906]AKH67762.1 CobN/Magnesium Chelatase [Spongiibacter sp. IMCC21906]